MNKQISTRKVSPSEVNIEFTQHLQGIAQTAWTVALDGSRAPEVVKQAFNPVDPVIVAEALRQYKSFARHGRLIVAAANEYGPTIGYAMARNDVSPKDADLISLVRRTGKRALAVAHNHFRLPLPSKYNRVFAWEKHVVAYPDAPKGIGTAAVKASLEAFYPDQISTAYIDDENEQSREFFASLGYVWDGNPDNIKIVYRFGKDNDPTTQRRYIAPVQDVIGAATIKLANLQKVDR